MRILHVISGLNPAAGGTTSALCGLVEAQRNAGLDIGVITHFVAETDQGVVTRLRDQGIQVHTIDAGAHQRAGRAALASALPDLVQDHAVVHIHAVWEPIQHHAARTAFRAGTPYVISPHGMLDPYSLRRRYFKKWLYRLWRLQTNLDRAAAVHCTTQVEAELAAPLLRQSTTIVESLGVDLREFETLPHKGAFRATHVETGQRPIVLFLSRLHEKKGLDILLEGFANARRDDALLVLAGPDDGYGPAARALAAKLGLQHDVLFTGMLHGADRIQALVDAHVMVLPSYQENFGIVVIEALACGTPVIISDQVNLHREIAPANVGAIIPATRDAVSETLTQWLADDARRQSAAQHARTFVRQTYDWVGIGQRWADHYNRLASNAHGVASN